MDKTLKKVCPVTGTDEISITFTDSKERDASKDTTPEYSCSQMRHPLMANLPTALADQLHKKRKMWCLKIKKPCPSEQIYEALF